MNYSLNELPVTLRVDEVAKLLRISKANVYLLVRNPEFPSVQIGRRIIIPRDAFLKWAKFIAE